jgi:hypothetical protein
MRDHVLLFMERFHAAILSGKKKQTIRRTRKRPILPNDSLSLRYWSGKPYRSKQSELMRVQCEVVIPVSIRYDTRLRVLLGDLDLSRHEVEVLSWDDGFSCQEEMTEFWISTHGIFPDGPAFNGTVIEWRAPCRSGLR